MKKDFDKLIDKLKAERDELKLKIHLGSMDAKKEFEAAEKKWQQIKMKAAEISNDTVETSEEYMDKAKVVGEELKEAYIRIAKRLHK
ncbi:Atg14 domain-containing protein [Psychromonas antarctica]|jgi:hypothetical protein|uniref:Atg14 domain-containing protein n=1 Tax=Psychromonas antarctica TaxID=67573 RepID=UPI001EE92355|nr:Atg14 domain-containing protein [Psychromonas antarctica]MCG6202700.1 Atg14 domain-containing protein [Psychromonas antarctica]